MIKWFVSNNEQVSGPFSSEQVHAGVENGSIVGSYLIWSRAMNEWTSVTTWLRKSDQIQQLEHPENKSIWHYAVSDSSYGPMTRSEMLESLSKIRDLGDVLVWTHGMKAWASIFDFHDILDDLGVNRRKHPRANISGSVVVNFEGETFIGQLSSISEGGIGAKNLPQLIPGQEIKLDIKSNHFSSVISVKARVQYVNSRGYAGLKFDNLHMEAKSTIIEYVKGVIQSQAA